MVKEYIILNDESPGGLERQVNGLLRGGEGWQPLGGVAATTSKGTFEPRTTFHQAMTRGPMMPAGE